MSNNLESNKIAAAILLAGVIAMFAGFFTNILYKPNHDQERGYKIAVAEKSDATEAKDEEIIDIASLIANADLSKGAKVSKKCVACHSFNQGGENKVGPNLYDIVGADIAAKPGYKYSDTLTAKAGNWSEEELFAFLTAPKKYAPGTKMSFAGIRKPQATANLIAFIKAQ